jgi:hypothetical protein
MQQDEDQDSINLIIKLHINCKLLYALIKLARTDIALRGAQQFKHNFQFRSLETKLPARRFGLARLEKGINYSA